MTTLAIGMPSPPELILLLVIVLIFFGVGKLPQVFGALGKGLKSFKDAQKDEPVDVSSLSEEASSSTTSKVEEATEVKS
jgi:sec-independent protein translocase protein TatA